MIGAAEGGIQNDARASELKKRKKCGHGVSGRSALGKVVGWRAARVGGFSKRKPNRNRFRGKVGSAKALENLGPVAQSNGNGGMALVPGVRWRERRRKNCKMARLLKPIPTDIMYY